MLDGCWGPAPFRGVPWSQKEVATTAAALPFPGKLMHMLSACCPTMAVNTAEAFQ